MILWWGILPGGAFIGGRGMSTFLANGGGTHSSSIGNPVIPPKV